MNMSQSAKIHKNEQRGKLIQTARKLGCDEDETVFEEKLKRIAKANPK